MDISKAQQLCKSGHIRWTDHVMKRMLQRDIKIDEVKDAILNGKQIEDYPNDYPFPSCLVMGYTKTSKCLHVVCGLSDDMLWIITSYCPDIKDWNEDMKTRKEASK